MYGDIKQPEADAYLRSRALELGIPFQEFLDKLMRGELRQPPTEDLTRADAWVRPMTAEQVEEAYRELRALFPAGTDFTDEELRAMRGPLRDDE